MVVSIHATLAGGDFSSVTTLRLVCTFLSTPPSRVATWVFDGEVAGCFAFLSTPPSRVATVGLYFVQIKAGLVSIHATLAGGDSRRSGRQSPGQCFYPRHPRGWRRNNIPRRDNAPEFLSTPPSRVATQDQSKAQTQLLVSIHATLAGGDLGHFLLPGLNSKFLSTPPSRVATRIFPPADTTVSRFYPRHPRGWRLISCQSGHGMRCFYPRHPRGWRPPNCRTDRPCWKRFYPRHPRGWRPRRVTHEREHSRFYPRHPRGWRRDDVFFPSALAEVSIHATLAGGDCTPPRTTSSRSMFLSTPPSRVATSTSTFTSHGCS